MEPRSYCDFSLLSANEDSINVLSIQEYSMYAAASECNTNCGQPKKILLVLQLENEDQSRGYE